jgi:AraC-like DNA-binding protein
MRIYLVFIFIFIYLGLIAQDLSMEKLQLLEDEELLTLFNEVGGDSLKQEIVARVYLERGRREKDTIKMARGYDRLARIFNHKKNIMFADSVIYLTQNMSNITYPALGYIIKSYEYHMLGDLILNTENALKGYELAIKNDNISQQIYLADYLIFARAIWGNKMEALELQKERNKLINKDYYFEKIKKSTRKSTLNRIDDLHLENELSSLRNFVFCYLNLKDLDSASIYLRQGLEKSKDYKGFNNAKDDYFKWFTEASVEIDFYSGKYVSTIETCNSLLQALWEDKIDNSSRLNLYFFKGLALMEIGEYGLGVQYLKDADSIFDKERRSIQPYQRLLFEILLEHYNSTNNKEKQIEYLNKLIYVDSIFKRNYQFFEPDLIKNFETPELVKEKEALINGLRNKNKKANYKFWWSIGILAICLIALIYYINRQLIYKRRFLKLIREMERSNNESSKTASATLEISSEIINDILSNLTLFERNQEYLSPNTSLSELANSLGTNPRYLSKVINLQKDKNFPQYINDLRVDYAINEMSENPKFRKYSIKAIAEECGFKSAESFSKSFYKRHRIYPSYYIKKIENLKI